MLKSSIYSKTGCIRCKKRRKKCDETRPECNNCQRLNLHCTWVKSAQEPIDLPIVYAPVVKRIPSMKNPVNLTRVIQNQAQFDMILAWLNIVQQWSASFKNREQYDVSMFATPAFSHRSLSHAIAAMGALNMAIFTQKPALMNMCLVNYQAAIRNTSKELFSNAQTPVNFPVQFATSLLGTIECTAMVNVEYAAFHFAAAFRLLRQVVKSANSNDNFLTILRMTTEACLFHLCLVTPFLKYSSLDSTIQCINWPSVESMWKPPMLRVPYGSQLSAHPGIHYISYKLILEITRASRSARILPPSENTLKRWNRDIEELIAWSTASPGSELSKTVAFGLNISKLYICALRILLLKVQQPGICSSFMPIAQIVSQGQHILKDKTMKEIENFIIFWPMLIIMCAIRDQDDFNNFVVFGQALWTDPALLSHYKHGAKRYWGHATAKIQEMRTLLPCDNNRSRCDGSHDGLDILLLPDGFSGPEVQNIEETMQSLLA